MIHNPTLPQRIPKPAHIRFECCHNLYLSVVSRMINWGHETMPNTTSEILEFVRRERELALSEREWKFRLRGYGFAIQDTERGQMITSLVGGREIGTLEAVA
jgi:hypothetical protein